MTTNVFGPNSGATVGDVLQLFMLDFLVPTSAQGGQTITIMPSEGFLQNVTVNDLFDTVSPQNFAGATLTIVPEPVSLALLAMAGAAAIASRRRR